MIKKKVQNRALPRGQKNCPRLVKELAICLRYTFCILSRPWNSGLLSSMDSLMLDSKGWVPKSVDWISFIMSGLQYHTTLAVIASLVLWGRYWPDPVTVPSCNDATNAIPTQNCAKYHYIKQILMLLLRTIFSIPSS